MSSPKDPPLPPKSRGKGGSSSNRSLQHKQRQHVSISQLDPEEAETCNLMAVESNDSASHGNRRRASSITSISSSQRDGSSVGGGFGQRRLSGGSASRARNRRHHGHTAGGHNRLGSVDLSTMYGIFDPDSSLSALEGGGSAPSLPKMGPGGGDTSGRPALERQLSSSKFQNVARMAFISSHHSNRPKSQSKLKGLANRALSQKRMEEEDAAAAEKKNGEGNAGSPAVSSKARGSIRKRSSSDDADGHADGVTLKNVARRALARHRTLSTFDMMLEAIRDEDSDGSNSNNTNNNNDSINNNNDDGKNNNDNNDDDGTSGADPKSLSGKALEDESVDDNPPLSMRTAVGSVDTLTEDTSITGAEISQEYGSMRDSYAGAASSDEEEGRLLVGGENGDNMSPNSSDDSLPHFKRSAAGRRRQTALSKKLGLHMFYSPWNQLKQKIFEYAYPTKLFKAIYFLILRSCLVWVSLPCGIVALILYYGLGNPELFFLPGEAKLSWWFNFVARNAVTFEFARLTQWLIIDGMFMSPLSVQLFGSIITFFCILSKGWPFVIVSWGLWNLVVLQGSSEFHSHWLYWTGFRIYNKANSGLYILTSEFFIRVLVAAILLGACTAIKRTILAIHFGRRQLAEFKPILEKILQDVELISEVAFIALEVELLSDEAGTFEASVTEPKGVDKMTWQTGKTVEFEPDEEESSAESSDSDSTKSVEQNDDSDGDDGDKEPMGGGRVFSRMKKGDGQHVLARSMSGHYSIQEALDRWEEPMNKNDKDLYNVTIHDVVRFRRVLSFIDDTHPFGGAFGPAGDRSECIDSAHQLYWRLLKCSPASPQLPFSTLALAAVEESNYPADDKVDTDYNKLRKLRRLFRPNADNCLPLLAFIQSIDTVYKRIRFFRATVGNASVIDNVLEKIINGVFFFCTGLMILSFLQINPWPLLVSMTSLLVSVSFALGPSVSKYVEGAALIALRRPYDLGDRVFVTESKVADSPGPAVSWFVEDITLATTTLRYSTTNEVCTISNSAIAASKIVNCNRSPNAVIVLKLEFHVSVFDKDNLRAFEHKLKSYVKMHPRAWDRLLFFRVDKIDADNERVDATVGFRHRSSWQEAGRINVQRGKLLKHIYKITKEMGIDYSSPPNRRLLYTGGTLKDPSGTGYKANLLKSSNIQGYSSDNTSTVEQLLAPQYHQAKTQLPVPAVAAEDLAPAASSEHFDDIFLRNVRMAP